MTIQASSDNFESAAGPSLAQDRAPSASDRSPWFTPEELAEFKARVSPLIGLDLDAYKPRQMERRISALLVRSKAANLAQLYEQLLSHPELRHDFVCGLTINVSEFFRNPERFEALRERILPDLLDRFARIKVWSAGCSMGAELYSVGILLAELGALERCELVGTDLDAKVIRKAEAAIYPDYEVRTAPPQVIERYFEPEGALYRFKDEAIKARCRFAVHNLLEDAPEPDCHLVLCRNVVIYFNETGKRKLYAQIQRALVPGGVLFVGNTERIFEHRELGFSLAAPFFYQKTSS